MVSIQPAKTYAAAVSASQRPLRIAQIAPLYESVPPKLYGGTERIVAYLTEELVRRGHQVTLYAAGDSTVRAPLNPGWPHSLRLTGLDHLGPVFHLPMLSQVYDNADRFDVIRFARRLLKLSARSDNARSDGFNAPWPSRHQGVASGLSKLQGSCDDIDQR